MLTFHQIGDYAQERFNFIKAVEGSNPLAYIDTKGIPTIGVGFNIGKSALEIRNEVILTLGINPNDSRLSAAGKAHELSYKNEIINILNKTYPKNLKGTALAAANKNLQSALKAVMTKRVNDPLVNIPNKKSDFSLTDSEMKSVFDDIIPTYEQKVDNWVINIPYSRERVALVSMAFNCPDGSKSLLGPKLRDAIVAGNRAEAWYEIRYDSNADQIQGIANRRYKEANEFWLYNDMITPDSAKEVMRMFTRHELFEKNPAKKISAYESKYSRPSGVDSINKSIEASQNYLIKNYAPGKTIDGWVIVGRGLDSYQYLDKGATADNIIGCSSNDLIFGEKGDDFITGGQGDDILYGGAGNDTYYINTGDGIDTIEDKEGINRVIVNGHLIGRFGKPVNGIRKTDDGLFMGEMKGTDFVVTEIATGTTVILNENFQEGDFGIYFIDTRNNPDTGNVINGDLNPLDTDPLQDGVQIKYDEWGNLITDPGQPDPGRIDTLRDTSGNDLINGGAGDDEINARWGGENWIKGGDGNDVIDGQASTNCILEGGSGSDIIFGSYVELNPVRAGIVEDPKDYRWSSYRVYAYGEGEIIVDEHLIYENLAEERGERRKKYREFVKGMMRDKEAQKGEMERRLVYGSEEFTERMMKRHKVNSVIPNRGRPMKEMADVINK